MEFVVSNVRNLFSAMYDIAAQRERPSQQETVDALVKVAREDDGKVDEVELSAIRGFTLKNASGDLYDLGFRLSLFNPENLRSNRMAKMLVSEAFEDGELTAPELSALEAVALKVGGAPAVILRNATRLGTYDLERLQRDLDALVTPRGTIAEVRGVRGDLERTTLTLQWSTKNFGTRRMSLGFPTKAPWELPAMLSAVISQENVRTALEKRLPVKMVKVQPSESPESSELQVVVNIANDFGATERFSMRFPSTTTDEQIADALYLEAKGYIHPRSPEHDLARKFIATFNQFWDNQDTDLYKPLGSKFYSGYVRKLLTEEEKATLRDMAASMAAKLSPGQRDKLAVLVADAIKSAYSPYEVNLNAAEALAAELRRVITRG